MKIAGVTMTMNDGFKFKEWCQWYEEYKDELYIHIVVDNASEPSYLQQVKDYFKDSIIIERSYNGGCTAAYNDGIKKALEYKEVDAIALCGNDCRFERGALSEMYRFLFSKAEYGMVGGVVFRKDSDIVEDFGDIVNFIGIPKINYRNASYSELPESLEVSFVPGGINMSKREFYETVGLQDENLFMYNDEIDMFYRARKVGYIEAVTKNAKTWHQHISNPVVPDMRAKMSFINGRNRVYIIKKHHLGFKGLMYFLYTFMMETIVLIRDIRDKESRACYISKIKGFRAGFKCNMDNSFIQITK